MRIKHTAVNQLTTKDTAWRDKAHKVIGSLCAESYRQSNYYADGTKYSKHRPYSVPQLAKDLVQCLNTNDEERAKAIFVRLAISPEWANDPENR